MEYTGPIISKILELYTFVYAGVSYRYTSNPQDVVVDGNTYTAATIKRDAIEKDNDISKGRIKIYTIQSALLLKFLAIAPPSAVSVTLHRHQPNITVPASELIFSGVIESINFDLGQRCIITCVESQQFLMAKFPAWIYQPTCNKQLYSAECGVNRALHKLSCSVYDFDPLTPCVFWTNETLPFGDGYFDWGVAEWNDESRLIIDQNGQQVIIQAPFSAADLETEVVDIYPGCIKTSAICNSKFSNKAKFLGFPHIPKKNPCWVGL